jgi:hypothetical protein
MTPDQHIEPASKLLAEQTASLAGLRSAVAYMKAAQRLVDTREQLSACLSQPQRLDSGEARLAKAWPKLREYSRVGQTWRASPDQRK